MAAKFDKEFLIKHHFWLLLAPFLLFALIAWIGLLTGVADATDAKKEELNKHENELKAVKPQPRVLISRYGAQQEELHKSRTRMWEAAWKAQKDIYTWPVNFSPDQLRYLETLSFGDEVNNVTIRQQFRDEGKYQREYQDLADQVAPLQFNGSWKAVLRHVESWNTPPTSEEIWLAMEDLWVERELVLALHRINQDAANFTPVGSPENKLHRKFVSRFWELDLEVVTQGMDRVLKGTIKNRTDRLLPLGVGNRMILKVGLDPEGETTVEFPVEGEFIAGGKTEPVKTVPEHKLPVGGRVVELSKVEQVLDGRTAPVKRVEKVALTHTSSRMENKPLKMTSFSQKAVDAAAAAAAPAAAAAATAAPMGVPAPVMPVGPGMPGASGGTPSTDHTGNGLARKRYIDRTDQVRRMEIALEVVVDEAFLQDVLVTLANCKLRFQNTQYHWSRFRGQLNYTSELNAGTAPTVSPRPFPVPRAPGAVGEGALPGNFTPAVPYMPRPGAVTSRSEDQLAASLVDLSVYGIASLYEPFKTGEAASAAPAPAPAPKSPAPKK